MKSPMDWPAIMQSFLSSAAPLLPGADWQRIALPLCWAIVLAFGVLVLGRQWPVRWMVWWPVQRTFRWRFALAGAIALLTLAPGPTSPAWWLGLAFQTPSLMSTLICLAGAVAEVKSCLLPSAGGAGPKAGSDLVHPIPPICLIGIALGWLLFLDTFAAWPISIYQWGFSPLAVALAALLVCLPWVFARAGSGTSAGDRVVAWLPLAVAALFVLTRLPSGNVWDALIDPWLWLALHAVLARRWLANFHVKRRASKAIRG